MVRDTGSVVEFWVKAGSSSTWFGSAGWSGSINGVNVGGTFSYPTGAPWVKIAAYTVTYHQTIRFSIGDTGTQGLGGPTDLYVTIVRSTIPPPPAPIDISQITPTSFQYRFQSTGTGGLPILEWQIGYGTSPTSVQLYLSSSGMSTLTGLLPNTTYYVWSRGRNAHGWGGWSARMSAKTLAGARVKMDDIWKTGVVYVKVDGVWRQAVPFVKKDGVWTATG